MAEHTWPASRFFGFAFPFGGGRRAPTPEHPRPAEPLLGREAPARGVGGLLEGLLADVGATALITAPPTTEVITDIERIEGRLRALAAEESLTLLRAGGAPVVRGRLVPGLADGPYPLQVRFEQAVPETPFQLDIQRYNALYRFEVARVMRVGDRIAVPMPARVMRVQHRATRRKVAPPGFTVTYRHPALPELEVERRVLDLSRKGLGVELRPGFTCLLEDGSPDCAAGLPVRDLGRGFTTLLSVELLPSFMEHVHEVTSPRLPKG